jgi:hypothetical protein
MVKRGNMSDDKELRAEAKAIMAKSKALRPWYKKKRYWLLALVVLLMVIPLFNRNDGDTSTTPETTTTASSALDEPITTTTVASPSIATGPTETPAQSNARRSGESYLTSSPFSRQGLIDQLQYEGFSVADSTYGVDALTANWNEQAAKSAAAYLKNSTFSRQGLIDQLIYEGYTQSQSEYGVSTTGL